MGLIGFPRSRVFATGLSIAFLLSCAVGAVAAPETEDREADRQVPFALAVRGGVSLGAYEAGFNWALLRYMKTRRVDKREPGQSYIDLRATSGASAGSINALISTISWCIDDERAQSSDLFVDAVSNNIFFDTWADMGFEELLPKEVDSLERYRADDGVLTRNAFQKSISRMEHLLATDNFRPGCEVRFGIMVTRVDPAITNVAGVEVHNQRFVIPLTLRVDDSGHARFLSCLVDHEDPAFGNVMYLQGTRTGNATCPIEHGTAAVIEAIEASSAFPVAFGRKHINYCEAVTDFDDPLVDEVGKCPVSMRHAFDEFIDGGLFDNLPLGVSKALAEPAEWGGMAGSLSDVPGRRINYIYLDPTIRRSVRNSDGRVVITTKEEADEPEEESDKETYGLRSQLRFLGGAIASSRDYELYNLLRGGDWTNQVFAHADDLAAEIEERYPGTVVQETDLSRLQALAIECSELLDSDWSSGAYPERSVITRAHECIVAQAYLLELEYKGVPFDQELKSHAEIRRQRNLLIDWIVRLAAYIGDDRLAMAVSRSRDDELGDRRILLSSRFSPVVGEMMHAFGGFVDRSFREYDYYAGVYDAIWGIANFVCERQPRRETCQASHMQRYFNALGIYESAPASTVFLHLLQQEFPASGSAFAWAETYAQRGTDKRMQAIARSLFAGAVETDEEGNDVPSMTAFIAGLIEEDFDASSSSAFLQRIFRLKDKDELTWYYPLTLRATNRLLLLERQETEVMGGGEIYTTGLTLGAFYLHSFMQEEQKTLNVSTAPDFSWQSWLPDEVAIDARNGGIDFSWYQGWQIGEKGWRWDVKFTPIQLNHSGASRDDNVWFSQADFLISRKKHGAFSAFGLGPSLNWTWEQWPNTEQLNVGAVIYAGFIEDKIRLTIGKTSFDDKFAGSNYYINIGINDVPGLVYWGASKSRGSWWPTETEW